MRSKKLIRGLALAGVFFIGMALLFDRDDDERHYGPYNTTIAAPVSGIITKLTEGRETVAEIGGDRFAFDKDRERTPSAWLDRYPQAFLAVGDSVFKRSGSDSFYVFRGGKSWTYLLPMKQP